METTDNKSMTTAVDNNAAADLMARPINKSSRTDLYFIDPRAIRVMDGFNVRLEEEYDLEPLKDSIRKEGVLEALSVIVDGKDAKGNPTTFRLVNGHRRLRAVMELIAEGVDIARVKATLVPRNLSEEELCVRQMLLNEGKRFTEYECGLMFQRFHDQFGRTITEIANRFSRDIGYVSRCLDLLNLHPDIQQSIVKKEIAVSAVREIVKDNKEDENAQVEAVKTLVTTAKANGKKTATLKDVTKEGKALKQVAKARLALLAAKELVEGLGEDSFMGGTTAWLDNLDDALCNVRGVEQEMQRLTAENAKGKLKTA